LYFIGDGIFDNLSNDEIFNKIWSYKKLGEVHNDIRALCDFTQTLYKFTKDELPSETSTSLPKNLSLNEYKGQTIFIAFKNFELKMKDPNFEYIPTAKTRLVIDQTDFSLQNQTK